METKLPNSVSLEFVEALYADYLRDPESVPPDWRQYFQSLSEGNGFSKGQSLTPEFRPWSIFDNPRPGGNGRAIEDATGAILQERVDQLIRNYRVRGHMAAELDPLDIPRAAPPELDLEFYGFTDEDLDRRFSCESMCGGDTLPLRDIVNRLRNTYCRSIGVQFMHIDDSFVRHWLQERMESTVNRLNLSREEQIRIFTRLTDAVIFEEFIRKKFIGAKSFSLEGAESLIPLLDLAIERAGEHGIDEIVLAMAHRGRLNVLANIMAKSPRQIFREFADLDPELYADGHGDVKYHLGYSSDWQTVSGRKIHLSLCFNPSHLEFVNPVALGRMRAKQDRTGDSDRRRGLVMLIHGDAAFAGEGIIQETLSLSQLDAYTVGGTLHTIVNNQIGFTTSPSQTKSSTYASDVAKMLQIPIFHVNGEDPEAVAQVVWLAMQTSLPADFYPHPKIEAGIRIRRQMAKGERPLDWAPGEALAFASLAREGSRIRLSGQDSERGTFGHRHAVLHDIENGRTYMPLQNLAPDQAPVDISNSPLSETGVLGFEYGYSLDTPDGLIAWEAQFGDFCNVAQTIVDQFVATAEEKWRRLSGITLLLPHGLEGQGPEHSSARLERFLELAIGDNIQIVQPTTPVQLFHCLRRQVLRSWRKPLILMTPKSLLRHPRATSTLDEFAAGRFERILPDALSNRGDVTRVLFCSGKIFFELDRERQRLARNDVAILRLEQLYPLSQETLRASFQPYSEGIPVYWVQEEPENMGAWRFLKIQVGD